MTETEISPAQDEENKNTKLKTWGSGVDFDSRGDAGTSMPQIAISPSVSFGSDKMIVSGVMTFSVSSAVVFVGDSQTCCEVAKHLLQRLTASPRFTRVTCMCLRKFADQAGSWSKDLTNLKVVDSFDDPAGVRAAMQIAGGVYDTAFVLMGATREEGGMPFMDIVLKDTEDQRCTKAVLSALKQEDCKQVHLLSSQSADSKSNSAFERAKAAVEGAATEVGGLAAAVVEEMARRRGREETLTWDPSDVSTYAIPQISRQLSFARLSIYRPGILTGKPLSCLGDVVCATAAPVMDLIAPKDTSVRVQTVAKAMMCSATAGESASLEILENEKILDRAGSKGDGWIDLSGLPELDTIEWDAPEGDKGVVRRVMPGEEGIIDVVVQMFTEGPGGDEEPPEEESKGGKRGSMGGDREEEAEWKPQQNSFFSKVPDMLAHMGVSNLFGDSPYEANLSRGNPEVDQRRELKMGTKEPVKKESRFRFDLGGSFAGIFGGGDDGSVAPPQSPNVKSNNTVLATSVPGAQV